MLGFLIAYVKPPTVVLLRNELGELSYIFLQPINPFGGTGG